MPNFYASLLDIAFPKQCLNCQAWGRYICKQCRISLTLTEQQRCVLCQQPSELGFTHSACQTRFTPDRLISIFRYQDELVSKMVNTGKLALISDLFSELASIAAKHVKITHPEFDQFVLCPIPVTNFKKRFRGFNQSELIAQIFSWRFNLAIDRVLLKSRSTKQQKSLNKEQRQQNLSQSFAVSHPHSLPSKVILIDDITTTGSTFIEASRVLKAEGVKTVWCLALAQD